MTHDEAGNPRASTRTSRAPIVRRQVHAGALVCVAVLALSIVSPAQAAQWLRLGHFSLIDGTGAPLRQVNELLARDGVIVAIDEAYAAPEAGDVVTTLDLGDAYVMPLLTDTHVHVARFPDTRQAAQSILVDALRAGIGAVRDLGGDARALAEINRAAGAGEVRIPTLVYSALFASPAVIEDPRMNAFAAGVQPGQVPWLRAVSDDQPIELLVAQARGAGASGLKLYGGLDARLANKVIRAANAQGVATWAHATVFPAAPGDLVRAGVSGLSHAPYLIWEAVDEVPDDYAARTDAPWTVIPVDHPKLLALFTRMAREQVFLDATLFVYKQMHTFAPQVQAQWAGEAFAWGAEATALAHRLGVPVTTGTDWFEPRGPGELPHTHQELQLLVSDAGFSPMQAIIAATATGAEALGIEATHGTIEVGKVADLLVLGQNPLEDVSHTTDIRHVIHQGALVANPLNGRPPGP